MKHEKELYDLLAQVSSGTMGLYEAVTAISELGFNTQHEEAEMKHWAVYYRTPFGHAENRKELHSIYTNREKAWYKMIELLSKTKGEYFIEKI